MSSYDAQPGANRQHPGTAGVQVPAREFKPASMNSGHNAPETQTSQAARAVMHPDLHDPDWRYYHAAVVN